MPKKKRTPTVPPTARPLRPRRRRERTRQALVMGLGTLAIAAIVGLTALGVYLSRQGLGATTALEVGDASFSTGYLLRRLRLLTTGQESVNPVIALEQVVRLVQQEEIVRQQAGTRDVSITTDDVDGEIANQLGVSLDDDKAFAAAYKEELQRIGLSDQELRRMVEAQLLEGKLRSKLTEQVPPSADQARLRLIVVANQADAQQVLDRLKAGDEFAELARELSLDALSKDDGGEKGWMPRGLFGSVFDAAVFALEPGGLSGPIASDQVFYIVEVEEKASGKELTAEQRQALGARAFADWVNEASASISVINHLDTGKINWVLQRASPQGGGG